MLDAPILSAWEAQQVIEALRETAERRDAAMESTARWMPLENLADRLSYQIKHGDIV